MSVQSFVVKTPTHTGFIFEMPLDDTGYIVLPPTVTPIEVGDWCGKFLRACTDEFEVAELATPITKRDYPKAEFVTVKQAVDFMPINLYRVVKSRYPAESIVHVLQNTHFAFVVENQNATFEIPLVYCEKQIESYNVYGIGCSDMSVPQKTQSIEIRDNICNGNIAVTLTKRLFLPTEDLATTMSKWSCKGHPRHHLHARVDPAPVILSLEWVCADCDKKQSNPACFVKPITNESVCYACTTQSGEQRYEYYPLGR